MSAPRTIESEYLAPAENALMRAVGSERGSTSFELRLQILEAASARFGGFDLTAFHNTFGIQSKKPVAELLKLAATVVQAIEHSPIHPALALSVLSREVLEEQDRKSTGAYHTDFRLASRLAGLAAPSLTYKSKAIDPACGAGILLVALTSAVCGMDRAKISYWFSHGVCAADLSANSLRAALLSLASFTDDIKALKKMRARWFCGDSLMADDNVWAAMAPNGFDAVIGNPPWEKVKLSRHEFLKSSGTQRHYGADIGGLDEARFNTQRDGVALYSSKLFARYPNLGKGEPDLYIAFTELFFNLCKEKGIVTALVPGGLIRSQGTQSMRSRIFDASISISLSIIDNRARFFSIDTRFKFLALALTKAGPEKLKREPIYLLHECGTPTGLETKGKTIIGRSALVAVRPDLSLPEVRNIAEWRLFSKIAKAGISWDEPVYGWKPKFCREVDMTKARSKFLSFPASGALPLIEGRMVQTHRFGVKKYISGSGRSALWKTLPIGESCVQPQFWIYPSDVSKNNEDRTKVLRIGFCDIAGQTNERSLMASIVPPNVICGNKVPTILFPDDPSEERLLVWTAIANSFVFDWMLRRILTTTVNYFLLQSVPLPKISKGGLPWQRLVNAAHELRELDRAGANSKVFNRMVELRSKIDAEVALAYGLNFKNVELVMQDFPLLDRNQPALSGELKSTITRDTVLTAVAKRTGTNSASWLLARMEKATLLGAIAYIPSELSVDIDRNGNKKGESIYG